MNETHEPYLQVRELRKSFGEGTDALCVIDGLNMDIARGEFVSIFGPNGCGKSTLLSILAGLLHQDGGQVSFGHDGGHVGMVFQNYDGTLLPWRRALDNITLPLEGNGGLSKRARRERARGIVESLGLRIPLDHYPYQMSGGQKQLTSIARAMVANPCLLLLDEPFASLDYQTRADMQQTLQDIWRRTGVTTVLVSHEIDEALLLADRLLLLTPLPARIAREYRVPFERPRTLESLASPAFVALRSEVLRDFHAMVSA